MSAYKLKYLSLSQKKKKNQERNCTDKKNKCSKYTTLSVQPLLFRTAF